MKSVRGSIPGSRKSEYFITTLPRDLDWLAMTAWANSTDGLEFAGRVLNRTRSNLLRERI